MQEVGFAFPRHEGGLEHLAAVAVAGHLAQHLIDGRALLCTRGKIEPAQDGIGLVAGWFEHHPQEFTDIVAQHSHLTRQAKDRDTAGTVRLFVHAVDDLIRETAQEQIEFRARLFVGIKLAVLGLKGHTPSCFASAQAETGEILAETCNQIRFGEQHIDREVDAQHLVDFRQTRPHRCRMRRDCLAGTRHHVFD